MKKVRLDPDVLEQVELDPALDPATVVDERELEETGAQLDDPEELVVMEGGADDPDGIGEPSVRRRVGRADHQGWELDPLEVGGGEASP